MHSGLFSPLIRVLRAVYRSWLAGIVVVEVTHPGITLHAFIFEVLNTGFLLIEWISVNIINNLFPLYLRVQIRCLHILNGGHFKCFQTSYFVHATYICYSFVFHYNHGKIEDWCQIIFPLNYNCILWYKGLK